MEMAVTEVSTNGAGGVFAGRRVLITGGTGFIGRYLVEELLRQGALVRVLVRSMARIPAAWKERVELCPGDLEERDSLMKACCKVETIIHAGGFAHAWDDDSQAASGLHWRVNAEGTRHLLAAAAKAGVKRFVFLSSVKAMGDAGEQCIDETWPNPPQTPYGRAKRAAELWVLDAGRNHDMHVVNLRLAMVYGPGNKGNLDRMIHAVKRGFFPPLPRIGNRRSMVHARDVARAALMAAEHPGANCQTYIVTDANTYSSREIYELILRALGKRTPRWAVPMFIFSALAWAGNLMARVPGMRIGFDYETLDKLLGWACYSSEKIRRELGYRSSWSLGDALPDMLRSSRIEG
jgi:nucleoside-diphosphate-sugar epimerase